MNEFVVSVRPDGNVRKERVPEGADLLSVIQLLCGGYIEIVETVFGGDVVMAVDEEGKIKGLPVNPAATAVLSPIYEDTICGTAVILSRGEEDLETLPEDFAEYLVRFI